MAFAFRLCLALLGLMSFLLSPVTSLAVDAQSAFPDGTESTSIPISETDGKPWPDIQPIDPPDPPVPTKLPVPTGTPFLIDTGLVVHVNTGQFFIIRLEKFLQTFFDGAKVYTNPRVSWIELDSERRAIIGQVPKDYPTSRILVLITGRYKLNGRVINIGYIVVLEVHGSVSITTPRWTPTPTVRPISSGTSRSASIHTTSRTTTLHTTLRTTPRTTASRTTTSHTTTSRTTTSRTATPRTTTPRTTTPRTPTTPLTTSRTIPSASPNPTFFPREKFTIPFDPYKRSPRDIVTSISTEPRSDWVRPNVPLNLRPTSLTGIVPATQPPGKIKVTLSIKTHDTGFLYIVQFIIVVRPGPDIHTLINASE